MYVNIFLVSYQKKQVIRIRWHSVNSQISIIVNHKILYTFNFFIHLKMFIKCELKYSAGIGGAASFFIHFLEGLFLIFTGDLSTRVQTFHLFRFSKFCCRAPLFSICSLPLGEISFSLMVSITIRADVSHVFAFSTVLFCALSFNHYFCFHFPHFFSNLICIVLCCIFSRIFFSFLTYSLCFDMLAIGIKFLTCLLVVMVL